VAPLAVSGRGGNDRSGSRLSHVAVLEPGKRGGLEAAGPELRPTWRPPSLLFGFWQQKRPMCLFITTVVRANHMHRTSLRIRCATASTATMQKWSP
jgi:hypothetical protein